MHTDQGAQFESELMRDQCHLWGGGGVTHTHTTPYHPQANSVVEQGDRALGDSLRTLLLDRNPPEWEKILPQIMRTFRGMPHRTTQETSNFMRLQGETRLPNALRYNPQMQENDTTNRYVTSSCRV